MGDERGKDGCLPWELYGGAVIWVPDYMVDVC